MLAGHPAVGGSAATSAAAAGAPAGPTGSDAADPRSRLRAQLTRATIFNRLARKADAVAQAAPALHVAEQLGADDLARALRVELARAAADAGPPDLALALLDPVLARPGPPRSRAVALIVAAESLAACGHAEGAADALAMAGGPLVDGEDIPADDGVLLRAAAHTVRSRQHRRNGAAVTAVAEARAGLAALGDTGRDTSEVRGQLVLELVLALLDTGASDDAARAASPLLDRPPRVASAEPTGWTALAIASRLHLPRGDHDRALGLLVGTVRIAERHRLDPVLVGCRDALVLLHEERGELAESLEHLRAARAAEHRRRRTVDAVRAAVDAFVPPSGERARTPARVAALLRDQLVPAPAEPEPPLTDADAPPPAPEMRRLGGGDAQAAGLGDLLAEALAAFQEGRRPRHEGHEADDAPRTAATVVAPGSAQQDPPTLPGTAEDLWRPPLRARRRAARD